VSRALLIGAPFLLSACATSSLVLMPDDEGHQGSVAVLEANGQPTDAVISEQSRTKLGDATPNSKPIGADGLKKDEAALLTNLPPPAKSFQLYFDQGTVNSGVLSDGTKHSYPGFNRPSSILFTEAFLIEGGKIRRVEMIGPAALYHINSPWGGLSGN